MPPSDRADAADELLDGLATAGHGKLAVTSTLRRLRKQTAMSSGLEGPAPAELQERWRGAVRDALEVGVTSLDGVVLMARRMGLAPSAVARLKADLDRSRELLRSAPERVPTGVAASGFSERLEPLLESMENHLAELKASARRYVSAELVAELRRVTEAHRSDLLGAGIELQAPAVTSIEGVRVFSTRLEVCFVLDNLLSNAIEAVRNSAQRRIELSMGRDGDRVSVTVSDTGVGIPEELKEDVFKAGVSSKAGGGHGLPRSRELLARPVEGTDCLAAGNCSRSAVETSCSSAPPPERAQSSWSVSRFSRLAASVSRPDRAPRSHVATSQIARTGTHRSSSRSSRRARGTHGLSVRRWASRRPSYAGSDIPRRPAHRV